MSVNLPQAVPKTVSRRASCVPRLSVVRGGLILQPHCTLLIVLRCSPCLLCGHECDWLLNSAPDLICFNAVYLMRFQTCAWHPIRFFGLRTPARVPTGVFSKAFHVVCQNDQALLPTGSVDQHGKTVTRYLTSITRFMEGKHYECCLRENMGLILTSETGIKY